MKIGKAVIPAAGWGTRFLPATKVLPKEMLPLIDKPLIQYIVEEAVSSGIEQIIIVTSFGKGALEDHFDRDFELEYILEQKGEKGLLEKVRHIADLATICYIRQKDQLGLGHAILTAKKLVGNEPFAVLLPDDIFDAKVPMLKQALDVYQRYEGSVIAVRRVAREEVNRYGIIEPKQIEERVYQVSDLVEKPEPQDAPSQLAIAARYIFGPEIFDVIMRTPPGRRGELEITDAISNLIKMGHKVMGVKLRKDEARYDIGNFESYFKSFIDFALADEKYGYMVRQHIRKRLREIE